MSRKLKNSLSFWAISLTYEKLSMFNLNLQYLFTSCLKYVFRNPLKLIVYSYCVGLTLSSGKGRFRLSQTSLRSEEHTSELQSRFDLVCRLLLEKKNSMLLCVWQGQQEKPDQASITGRRWKGCKRL